MKQGTYLIFLYIAAYDVPFHANPEDLASLLTNFQTFHLSTEASFYIYVSLSLA
jgi:hypothetical protein